MKDADVHEVMDSVLSRTNLTYRILENNLIVISEKKQKQATPVKGNVQVKNKDGSATAASDVSVVEKGTTNGTRTDENGNFTISVSDPNATLLISYVGYVTQEYPLNGQTTITIALDAG